MWTFSYPTKIFKIPHLGKPPINPQALGAWCYYQADYRTYTSLQYHESGAQQVRNFVNETLRLNHDTQSALTHHDYISLAIFISSKMSTRQNFVWRFSVLLPYSITMSLMRTVFTRLNSWLFPPFLTTVKKVQSNVICLFTTCYCSNWITWLCIPTVNRCQSYIFLALYSLINRQVSRRFFYCYNSNPKMNKL